MKKINILKVSLLFFSYSNMMDYSWELLIDKNKKYLSEECHNMLLMQYDVFKNDESPAIADAKVKAICITESGDDFIDLKTIQNSRIIVLEDENLENAHEKKEDIDERSHNHSIVRKQLYNSLEKMIVYLDNLSEYFGYEKGSLIIHVFEGLRDIKTQKKLFDEKFNTILKNNCNLSQEEAYIETCKWVSPYIDNVPAHATGGAIDIILWDDKQKKYCDMGRFNVGGNEAPTFSQSSRLTSEQKNNRLLFYCAATEAGLVNYAYEWWHFSINDKYATYWKNYVFNRNDNASYGVV